MDPPSHALVSASEEKSHRQTLDHAQPGLALKPTACGMMRQDGKRQGTTTMFDARNTVGGIVVGRCRPRLHAAAHPQALIRFLNVVDVVPAGQGAAGQPCS